MVTEEINDCMEKLLTDLRNFQDRQYQKDPIKVQVIHTFENHDVNFGPDVHYRLRPRGGMCVGFVKCSNT